MWRICVGDAYLLAAIYLVASALYFVGALLFFKGCYKNKKGGE